MTQYLHKVAFTDAEYFEVEKLAKDAIKKFKRKHGLSGPPLPQVWDDIIQSLRSADRNLLSWSETTENGTVIHINPK